MENVVDAAIHWAGVIVLAIEKKSPLTTEAKTELKQACLNRTFRKELIKELGRLGYDKELGLDILPA